MCHRVWRFYLKKLVHIWMILKSWGTLSSTASTQNFLQVFLGFPRCFCSGITKSSIPHTTYIYLMSISKFSTTGHTVQSLSMPDCRQNNFRLSPKGHCLTSWEQSIFGVSLLKLQVSLKTTLGCPVRLWETWSSLWWKEQREECSPPWLLCTEKF